MLQCNAFDYSLQNNYTMPPASVISDFASTNFSYTKVSPSCDCSEGFPHCPASAGGDILFRPVTLLKTTDYMYDLTGRNVSDWLVKTELSDLFFKRRYGGFEFLAPTPSTTNLSATAQAFTGMAVLIGQITNMFGISLIHDVIQNLTESQVANFSGLAFKGSNSLTTNEPVKLWYNTKGYDSSVSYLNVLNNAILRGKIISLNMNRSADAQLDPNEHGKTTAKSINFDFSWFL